MIKIVLIVFSVIFMSCGAIRNKEPEVVIKTKEKCSIQMVNGWYEHYFHDQLNFKPLGLQSNKTINYLTIYVTETELSIYDFIKKQNESKKTYYNKLKVEVEKKQTSNGECFIEYSIMTSGKNLSKRLVHFYKYKNTLFAVGYNMEEKHYDTYIDDAKKMMNSFKIVKK